MGGSTNAVLHFLAIARAADIKFTLEDFQKISDTTPFIADLKPSGKYLMEDVHRVGGIPAVLKYLLNNGLLHGDCLTVTGKTLAENLADAPDLQEGQEVIKPLDKPIKATGHLRMLYGNLAENGSVAKITGKEGLLFKGTAKVFNGDGRFSGGTHGFVVGHISPEAQEGGVIALVEDGDIITIDAETNSIRVEVSEEELAKRKKAWIQPDLKFKKGVLYKYARSVSSASEGCVTDEF